MKKLLVTFVLLALVTAACAPLTELSAETRGRRPRRSRATTTTTTPAPVPPPAPPSTPPAPPSTPPAPPPAPPPPSTDSVPAPAGAGRQWVQKFGEEFNGTDYDHAKLTPCFDWNYGACTGSFNNGREWYSASQVRVNNGTAKLVAEPGTSPGANNGVCFNGQCTYRSGMLSTARQNMNDPNYLYEFTYGYVEAKLKLPATKGFYSSFWLLPTDRSYNYRSEIDIVEVLGYDPTTMYMTYHYANRSQEWSVMHQGPGGKNGVCSTDDKTGKFVRFGIDWEPTYIAWYIDGVKCGQFTGNTSTIENGPMQIILNMQVDMSWERGWGYFADPGLTRQLEVDYLRVYQQQ